jgi:hypothetical protein
VRKLRSLLDAGRLNQVRQWWHTADAIVLPLLISAVDLPPYKEIDHLVRWALENCANNYAVFQRDLKALKKQIRKEFAQVGHIDHLHVKPTMVPYVNACRKKQDFDGPADFGRYILLWTQTRATGMADSKMIDHSVEKFISTVQEPEIPVPVNPAILNDTLGCVRDANPALARLSVGTTSCLEATRKVGGKTTKLKQLARKPVLSRRYDYSDLSVVEEFEPRPVRTSDDVLQWATDLAIRRRRYVTLTRLHVVSEPSKARTITVAPFAYQVIMGVFSHVYQETLRGKSVRSGLRADRHLWRFLQDNLNPQNTAWGNLTEGQVFALSTDLSEATDFGNKGFAKEVLNYCIRATPQLPRGLSVLMKALYTSTRTVLVPWGNGYFKAVKATRGWFMGDMMTKFMLTVAHDYCCRLSGLATYTLVGDDEIALESQRELLVRHIGVLSTLFKVSDADTYISDFFAFYCEEGTILPQYAHDSNHVRMRRGKELNYLDYPRIRLLLHQKSETDTYSMSNQGRFSLLGKEARWVDNTNREAIRHFHMASLYQHLLVPQDADCISPFTPLEMGGDGGFPSDPLFLKRVLDDVCRHPREAKFRIVSLLNNDFNFKFLRSERLDKVVYKHHLYLPKVEGLKRILPPEAVLEPKTDETKLMLRSLRFRDIESPQATFMRLCRGYYYKYLLEGKIPPEPIFAIDREFTGGHTDDPLVDYPQFLEKWKNPGFVFQDWETYFVRKSLVESIDPMSLHWEPLDRDRYPTSRDLFNDWAEANISFEDTSLPDVIATIRDNKPLPQRVVDRLNLFMESDSYVLHQLHMLQEIPRVLLLITRDFKLCRQVQRSMSRMQLGLDHDVIAVDPTIYMIGMMDQLEGQLVSIGVRIPKDPVVILDPGAMLHVDYTEFTDGFPHDEEIWDKVVKLRTHPRYWGVHIACMEWDN